jgi:hypothetical protein
VDRSTKRCSANRRRQHERERVRRVAREIGAAHLDAVRARLAEGASRTQRNRERADRLRKYLPRFDLNAAELKERLRQD